VSYDEIEKLRAERWARGREHYRPGDVVEAIEFVGDPMVELLEEIADALNYIDVAKRQAALPRARLDEVAWMLRRAASLL